MEHEKMKEMHESLNRSDNAIQNIFQLLSELYKAELDQNALPCARAQFRTKGLIGEQSSQCRYEGGKVPGLDEQALQAIVHDVSDASERRPDDGLAKSHRFQKDEAEAFARAWQRKYLGRIVTETEFAA